VIQRAFLTVLGHQVVVAENGQQAVSAYGEQDFDLVLMDCQMPVMDGYDASRAIRAIEPEDRHTVIIALTASTQATDRERCLEAGMDDHLGKPVALKDLAAKISHWLGAAPDDRGAIEPARDQ